MLFIQSKIMRSMLNESIYFFKASFIYQQFYSFPGCKFAFIMLGLDTSFTTAE